MKSRQKKNRRLADVIPPSVVGLQGNVCRTPGCPNFGVPPAALAGTEPSETEKNGHYTLFGSVGKTSLRCAICHRHFSLISNRALFSEVRRTFFRNELISINGCPNSSCQNYGKPFNRYPTEYYGIGVTTAGRQRKRCKKCGSNFTVGAKKRRLKRLEVHKEIIHLLANNVSLNGILRRTGIRPKTLYERIDFIHRQMVGFEEYRLRRLWKSPKFAGRFFPLCTDAQDSIVNWMNRRRREHVQLSCIATADNFTGFIFRTDVNFDPGIGECGKHFEELYDGGDFWTIEGLGLSARYEFRAFVRAAWWSLLQEAKRSVSAGRRDEIRSSLKNIRDLYPDVSKDFELSEGNPLEGAVIRRTYTAIAHYLAISNMFPREARLHLITDPDGALLAGLLIGMKERIKWGQADVSVVSFNKSLTVPTKRALVDQYKKKLDEFAHATWPEYETAAKLRRAFLKEFAGKSEEEFNGIPATWWDIPVQTMYEPDKCVGVIYQRPEGSTEDMEARHLTILDRSSLHAVDSFFNFTRQRVSFFHRPGMSRSSRTFYNAFQPYRADMVQKIIDIIRVYYNWVERRQFRTERKFDNVEERVAKTAHDLLAVAFRRSTRSSTREDMSTPAMRLGLAKGPAALDKILYQDWLAKL